MNAEQLGNLGSCSAGNALGFNSVKGCADLLLAAEAIWLLSPQLVIQPDDTVNLDYIKGLQRSGMLVVIKDVATFAENGNDDAVETLEDDTMILTNKGKYKFMATFAKGLYYRRALASIEGQGNWSTVIVDKKGDIFLTEDVGGGHKGFTTGMIKGAKLAVASNTISTKSMLEFQMLNRFELDEAYVRYENDNLDFDPRQIEAITQVKLSLVNNPADSETTITVSAVVDRGRSDTVEAINFDQFLNVVEGQTQAPTAGDDAVTAGTYPLTVPALTLGENGSIRLFDSGNNSSVIEIPGDGLYKSNVVPYTVL